LTNLTTPTLQIRKFSLLNENTRPVGRLTQISFHY
jgi:hypothetical protein